MKIYTKTGDKGETSLFSGERVQKHSLRIDAYGTVDELNSLIGICRSIWPPVEIENYFEELQELLFVLGSDLATKLDSSKKTFRISEEDTHQIERHIDKIDKELPQLKNFILPGGCALASYLHFARTIARKSERLIIFLSTQEEINPHIIPFINRLSDFLFVLARYSNKLEGKEEIKWNLKL